MNRSEARHQLLPYDGVQEQVGEHFFTNEAPGMTWLHAAGGRAAGCSAKVSEMTPRWPNET